MKIFVKHTWLFTRRSLLNTIRNPFAFIPNMVISLFFLLVYQAGLSGISELPAFGGASYLGLFCLCLLFLERLEVQEVQDSHLSLIWKTAIFPGFLLTPASRLAIVLGPIIAGMLQLLVQTILIMLIGFIMGLKVITGFGGVVVVLLLAVGWGLAFAGLFRWVALRTKNAQAAQAERLSSSPFYS